MTDFELMRRMQRCGHLLYHRRGGNDSQGRILRILQRNGGAMTQKELQETVHIKPGSLSEVVAKVEAAGLVGRERHPEDKRSVLLRLTPAGEARAAEMEAQVQELSLQLFAPLSPEDKESLYRILGLLSESWMADCACREHIKEES